MSEYSPAAIYAVFNALTTPGKVLSGILGDAAHTYGYHRGRNYVSRTDYSVTSTLDKQGDGDAASALDVSLPPDQMKLVTAHLIAGLQTHDPRLRAVRECFGTVNGTTVTGWDQLENSVTTSDDSHLWHVHMSFYRAYTNDGPTLLDVAAYINDVTAPSGGGTPIPAPIEGDDMSQAAEAQIAALYSLIMPLETFGPNALSNMVKNAQDTRDHVLQAHQAINIVSTQVLAVGAKVDALNTSGLDDPTLATELATQLTATLPAAVLALLKEKL